jgi:hypothetical protein
MAVLALGASCPTAPETTARQLSGRDTKSLLLYRKQRPRRSDMFLTLSKMRDPAAYHFQLGKSYH